MGLSGRYQGEDDADLGRIQYYPRFGFTRASDYGLGNEYGADEAFMVLERDVLLAPEAHGHSKPT